MGDFEKKSPASACWKKNKLHAAKMKEKKILALLQEKKVLQSYFIIPGGALQNPRKTATIPDNLQASKQVWLAY